MQHLGCILLKMPARIIMIVAISVFQGLSALPLLPVRAQQVL